MSWIDAVGWAGSALLIFSLLQARVLRLRILNLIACLVLVFFNAVIEVWPMVAMNIVLAGINIFFITKLLRERHDEDAYAVVEVGESDAYLEHFVRTHEGEIGHFFPHFFVLQGDETVGVVVVRDAGDGVAQIELDYVTPKYRDFTPGEFVYRRSGLFTDRGFTSVRTAPDMVAPYYERLGFAREGTSWRLEVR